MWNEHNKQGVTAVGVFVASMLFGCNYWYAFPVFSLALSATSWFSFAGASKVGSITGLLVFPFTWFILRRKRVRSLIVWMSVMGFLTSAVSMFLLGVVCSSNRLAGTIIPLWFILGVPVLCGAGSCLLLRRLLTDQSKPKQGSCWKCGYDLTGNASGVCSECGAPVCSES